MHRRSPKVSVIIPIHNESKSLVLLFPQLQKTLANLNLSYEIIFVNDGSTDTTQQLLAKFAHHRQVKIIEFIRNYGQTCAISAGIDYARGDLIFFLDADLQNDPKDIPKLLHKLHQGYDVVSGWRKQRSDEFFTRSLPSIIANRILSVFLTVPIHDFGCTLKVYKKEYLQTKIYGEMHRLLPYIAFQDGARIGEIEVKHNRRKFGKSHYSLNRTYKVIIDMIMLKLFYGYSRKPGYVFGGLGILTFLVALLLACITLWQKIMNAIFVHRNPIFLLSMFALIASIQFILLGFVAEFLMRTYYESQHKPTYKIRSKTNID